MGGAMPPIEFFIAFFLALIIGLLSGTWIVRLFLKKKKQRENIINQQRNKELAKNRPSTKAAKNQNVITLTRHSKEKLLWSFGLVFAIYFLSRDIYKHASAFRIYTESIIIVFLSWGTLFALRIPDVLIDGSKIYLFGRLSLKPISVSRDNISSIDRSSKVHIWRVSVLTFHLKNGDKITFSTGANEGRMIRIIAFIEKETSMKIKYSK
jgi:uncharacterized protein YneF (UPF0154 family)